MSLGEPREHHETIGSTNERARELAEEGAAHGTLVTAGEQTAGRGRQGRSWATPPGVAIAASLILREFDELLPLRAGLAVADIAGPSALVKWPNDVWVDGDVDADAEDRPLAPTCLHEDAGDLAPGDRYVVGPLDQRVGAGDVRDREPGPQRQQLVELAQDQRSGDGDAGRRRPLAALTAATRGLLIGGDERAVCGSVLGQLARALVGGADGR